MNIIKCLFTGIFVIIFSLLIQLKAQNYIVAGTDTYMDGLCAFYANGKNISYADLGKVSYAFDTSQDSVWFKIETYSNSPRNMDFGFYILIDKDNNLANGINTGGGTGQCTGITTFNMNYDVLIQHSFNGNNVAANFSASSLGAVTVRYIDTCVTIARTKLSLVDHNSDGNINFIVGLGGKNKEVYDIFPDTGFVNTGALGVQVEMENSILNFLNVSNPCTGETTIQYYLSESSIVNVFVYDITGMPVLFPVINSRLNKGVNGFIFDAEQLKAGLYFIEIRSGKSSVKQKIVIQ